MQVSETISGPILKLWSGALTNEPAQNEAPLPPSCWDQSPGLSSLSAVPDRYHGDPSLEGMSVKLANLSRAIHSSSVTPESRGRV